MDIPKISALMMILVLHVQHSQAQDTSGCAYIYGEQPLTNLQCNPYPNNRLILRCAVQGPAQLSFSIVWYWDPLNSQRLSASKYDFTVSSSIDASSRAFSNQLRVQQLNDNDAGWYYCQGELSNGTLLAPSNRLFLDIQSEYVVNASTCLNRAQTTTVRSCASIATDSSTTASTVSTTSQNPITDSNNGSADPSSSSPTDGNHHPSVLATIITLAPTPTVTSVPDPESDNLQVVLYSMAAIIVVFCATTVTLGISVVILVCRKRCHVKSKKTADQEHGANPFTQDATRNSGGADIPIEECVAYGTHEERRGRGDITTSVCPAYGVAERQQEVTQDDGLYEN